MLQHLGRLPPLQHAVLSPSQETLEEILSDGEANDQLLPWEQWPVEEPSETLCVAIGLANGLKEGMYSMHVRTGSCWSCRRASFLPGESPSSSQN